MTVPPLFGWEHILVALLALVVLTLIAFALLAVGRGGSARSDWQAWLDERSAGRRELPGELVDRDGPGRGPVPAGWEPTGTGER